MAAQVGAEARSARAVADAARMVEESIRDTGEPDVYAVEQLERIAAEEIDGPQALARQGFEPLDAVEEPVGDVSQLATVVTQLSIGNALLAAGRAVGEGPDQLSTEPLAGAVAELTDTADALDALDARSAGARQGFQADARSVSPEEAVESLTVAADGVLTSIVQVATSAVAGAFTESVKLIPGRLGEAVGKIGEKIDLGSHAGRLVRLGLRAVQRALDLFARLFPAELLAKVRTQVEALYDRLGRKEPGPAVVAWLVGADEVRELLRQAKARPDADPGGVDDATAEVERLGARFVDLGELATGLVKGIVGVGAALAVLQVALPHLPVITAGALALVVAGVVLLSADYVGAKPALRSVRGVKLVVTQAVG